PSYISTYIERDVRNIIQIGNLRDFNRFIRAIAIRTAQNLSFADISRDVGVSPNTIKSWVSVLEASNIIYLLEPYYRNLGKRLVKSPKIYFLDTGLCAYLMGLYTWQDIINSPMAGAIWESYVFNQIFRHLLSQGNINPPLYYWRTKEGYEIDFIVEKGGQFITFEAKLSDSQDISFTKGMKHFKNYYGADSIIKAYLLSRVKRDYTLSNGIRAINGLQFDF
ncbi:MAG: DUF4143 domain-containing protein, partial [Thermodesulfovibrionales bacterium]|nr:DUF4143 domain-containing protein [Thermodesulfovibrionales bacterium]